MTVLFTIVLLALLMTAAVIDSRSMRMPNALNAVIARRRIAAPLSLDRPLIDALLGIAFAYGRAADWEVEALARENRELSPIAPHKADKRGQLFCRQTDDDARPATGCADEPERQLIQFRRGATAGSEESDVEASVRSARSR
ncbi:MAG: hypothetical protein M0D54_20990 [Hyphomonadaceae bacterium JAD_PAG50586_4]|nr:MAG: hypothetical protein M0D54_20990 [Hyphomonadaceae bacterium JAD_PAG50586_4]